MGLESENGRWNQPLRALRSYIRENLYGVVPSEVKKKVHPSLRHSMTDFEIRNSFQTEWSPSYGFSPFYIDSRFGFFLNKTVEHWGGKDKRVRTKATILSHRLGKKQIILGIVPSDNTPKTVELFIAGKSYKISAYKVLIPSRFPRTSGMSASLTVATIANAIDLEIHNAKNPPEDALQFIKTTSPVLV